MLSDEFLPIRAVQFVLLCFAVLAAYATNKNRAFSYLSIYGVAVWLLYFKISEYAGSGRLPLDISAICYFLYGFFALLPVRPLKVAAAQLCALCGLVYAICMLAMPQVFYHRDPTEIGRYFAVANHSLLFFGGLAMMVHVGFRKTDLIYTAAVLGAIIVYTEICVAKGVQQGTAIFSQIVDGSVILVIAPGFTIRLWYYVVYYLLVAGLLGLWVYFTYAVNRRAVPNNIKRGFFAA